MVRTLSFQGNEVTKSYDNTRETMEHVMDQSQSNLCTDQVQSSYAPGPSYITCSHSRQAASTTSMGREDTPENATLSKQQNIM